MNSSKTKNTYPTRSFNSAMLLISILFFAIGCSKNTPDKIVTWPHGVYYEVFVQSFYDSNGDGIGDFKGLTQKLDYIKDLGVNGVWLMPIMPSPSYHKYDVVDYKGVHPDYGTEEDFKTFVAEAHKRDLKVIIDLILNHCGSDHPWFQGAIQGKENPYRDYFVWAKKDSIREQIAKKTISLDSDNITQWNAVNGDTTADHYYSFFYSGMPDLNFDNPAVRNEFVEIGRYWLTDMQVDGFRLDAAKHIFPDDRAEDNHAFWVWFRTEMEKIKPDVYMVGEVWSAAEQVAPYMRGIPALFNFDLGYAITNAVKAGKDSVGVISAFKKIVDFYQSITKDYIDATFLKNHDQNRILNELDENTNKLKVAVSILMTMPGTPYIYYGEEIGMLGMKPDEHIREPFIWNLNGADKGQASWIEGQFSNDQTVIPLSKQVDDPNSLYNFYKGLIALRNKSRALSYGGITTSGITNQETISFIRTDGNESLLVIHNITGSELSVAKSDQLNEFDTVFYGSVEEARVTEGEYKIPAYATLILN